MSNLIFQRLSWLKRSRTAGKRNTFLLSCVFFVASCAQNTVTSTASALEKGQRFKDWTVGCEKLPDNNQERCFIFQTVVKKDDESPILQMAVGYMPGIKEPTAILTVPLGVTLPEGIRIKVDENERVMRIPYERCIPRGCIAGLKVNDEVLSMFKKGVQAKILIFNGDEPVTLPISLKGFTAGFQALR